VIKVTFEGKDYHDVAVAMTEYLFATRSMEPEDKPEKPVKPEKPAKPEKPEPKPDAKERMAKVRAAKEAKKKPEPLSPAIAPEVMQVEVSLQPEKFEDMVLEPDPIDEPEAIDPTKLAALRVKTTEDLQAAYSSGKHKQVLALLSKYGNGAKSFRELQIMDFIPIRKAIDEGALA
jgi:outer membrane biosynthesis protein TonB